MTIAVPRGNHTPRARVQPVSNFCGIDSSESMAKTALGLRLFFTLLVMTRLDASLGFIFRVSLCHGSESLIAFP